MRSFDFENATALTGEVIDAVEAYRRARHAYTVAKEARTAVRNIAGLVAASTVEDVNRAARQAELELNALLSSNEYRPLLKRARAAGIDLSAG